MNGSPTTEHPLPCDRFRAEPGLRIRLAISSAAGSLCAGDDCGGPALDRRGLASLARAAGLRLKIEAMPKSRAQPSEFVRTLRTELAARLATLEPAVREYEELTTKLETLGRETTKSAPTAGSRSRQARAQTSSQRATRSRTKSPSSRTEPGTDIRRLASVAALRPRRHERHPTPALASAALALVAAEPGLKIPELAARLGCLQNPLYAILGEHERRRRLVKKGRGWYPLPGAAAARSTRENIAQSEAPSAEAA